MRPATISTFVLAVMCPPLMGQGQTGDRVYHPRQVVTIEISGTVDEIQRDEISKRVPQLMNPGEYTTRFSTSGDLFFARVAPISDVKAFAAKIDFGKVTSIDDRTITVKATPVKGAGTAAGHPLNRALEGIKSSNEDIRCSALKQLADMEPKQRREEVVSALQGPFNSSDSRTRMFAIDALAVWGTIENAPALRKVLDSRDSGPRRAAIKALGQWKDAASIEPISRRLVDRSDRSDVVKALAEFGPAAEWAALRALEDKSKIARAGACEVLQKIGTRKSEAALEAAKRDSDTWVRSAAESALKAIRRRL